MMKVEIYGMPKEIEQLYINLGKPETIFCTV